MRFCRRSRSRRGNSSSSRFFLKDRVRCRLWGISGRCRASVRRFLSGEVCYGDVSLSVGVRARVIPCRGMGVVGWWDGVWVGDVGTGMGLIPSVSNCYLFIIPSLLHLWVSSVFLSYASLCGL